MEKLSFRLKRKKNETFYQIYSIHPLGLRILTIPPLRLIPFKMLILYRNSFNRICSDKFRHQIVYRFACQSRLNYIIQIAQKCTIFSMWVSIKIYLMKTDLILFNCQFKCHNFIGMYEFTMYPEKKVTFATIQYIVQYIWYTTKIYDITCLYIYYAYMCLSMRNVYTTCLSASL